MTAAPPSGVSEWLGSTPLMDLDDPALRVRVQALTQLKPAGRARVLAVHGFVKRLPLRIRAKRRLRTATEVLRAGSGDAAEKATLLVAMLRLLGIPARLRYVSLRAPIVAGLGVALLRPARPIVEMWIGDRWVGTDTYIFDPPYMAAARQRLKDRELEVGYGIHVQGATVWDGREEAYVSGRPPGEDPMVAQDLGVHHDPGEFLAARARTGGARWRWRLLQWNFVANRLQRRIERVRQARGDEGSI